MIQKENYIEINGEYHSGIAINVYKNEVSICQASVSSKDGNIYSDWVFPQDRDRNPGSRAIPHKIPLGLKQQAIQRIEQLLLIIEKL